MILRRSFVRSRTINAVVVDVDVVAEVFPAGAVSNDLVHLRVVRCLCWRLGLRRRSTVAVGHQRLQNGPRASLAAGTARPVVHHPGRLVDAVSRAVGAVGVGPVLSPAAVARQGTGAVERASNVDKVTRRTVQRHVRRSAGVTGTLARRFVNVLRQHCSIRCNTQTALSQC